MKVTLHTQTKEIKDGKLIKIPGEFIADLDTTLVSQMRFESKFPEMAAREDLISYAQRIMAVKELTVAKIISELKIVYCFFDTDKTFIEFLKMFDLADEEYVLRFVDEIKGVFDLVLGSSSEKN